MKIARELLPRFDYTESEIEKVCHLIMVTKMPQRPTNLLENILCDADLYYLGTDRYLPTSEQLFVEWNNLGQKMKWEEWEKRQVQFLKAHKYFTKSAISQLTHKKAINLLLYQQKNSIKHKNKFEKISGLVKDYFLIIVGASAAAFSLVSFLKPNGFLDGGVTGISLLLNDMFPNFNLSLLTIVLNIPFIIASYYVVSHKFAYKSFFSILLLSAILLLFEHSHLPEITKDPLLVSIFGGFLLGLGSGLAMRSGSVLDGTEVLALYTFRKTSFTVSEIIFAANIVIFTIAAIHKNNVVIPMYCLLTYFTASKTIDYVVEGIEEYTGVTIISGSSELIKTRLVNEMGKSITIYKGERGYLPGSYEISSECDIIFTVITRLEMRRLKNLVQETDPKAFVIANTIKDASGGILKHRGVH